MYCWLANGIAVFHAGLILVYLAGVGVVLSGRLGRTWPLPFFQKLYLTTAFFTCLSHVVCGTCVLTILEKQLRALDDLATVYEGSYLDHYASCLPSSIADSVFLLATLAAFIGAVQLSYWRLWKRSG